MRDVLLVGHCGPDAFMLKSTVERSLEEVAVHMVNDGGLLQERLQESAMLLVNRELDGDFGTRSGVELIRRLAGQGDAPPMLLVSIEKVLRDLSEWIITERKCCEFFRFELTIEPNGPVALAITGAPGVKEFIGRMKDEG